MPTFSPPACAPLAQGAKLLTGEIWVRPTYATTSVVKYSCVRMPVKFYPHPLRFAAVVPKADFEQIHIALLCSHMTAYNQIDCSAWTTKLSVNICFLLDEPWPMSITTCQRRPTSPDVFCCAAPVIRSGLKPNSITLASSELASVMEFGF